MTPAPRLAEYVLDPSVAVKWFVHEQDLSAAWQLQDAHLAGLCQLVAPELLLVELANALKAGRRFAVEEVQTALQYVKDLRLRLESIRWDTLQEAVALAGAHRTAVYDAYFLAMAVESGRVLVTADETFLRKVGAHSNVVSLRLLRLPG